MHLPVRRAWFGQSSGYAPGYLIRGKALPQIDAPFPLDEFGDDTEGCPSIGPTDGLRPLGRVGAEVTGIRRDAHTPEIEPVGVPAGPDGDVGMSPLMGVPCAGSMQESKLRMGQLEQTAANPPG